MLTRVTAEAGMPRSGLPETRRSLIPLPLLRELQDLDQSLSGGFQAGIAIGGEKFKKKVLLKDYRL